MTDTYVNLTDAIIIEPPITRAEIAAKIDSGEYVLTEATEFHYTADGHAIRIGNLCLDLVDGLVKFVCPWPGSDVTAAASPKRST